MKKTFITLFALLLLIQCQSQKKTATESPNKSIQPKLVLGLVIDQMRYDYLYRFYNKYGEDGFKRLLNNGFNCENTHLNYIPTHTAVGHSSIYTGATPKIHGIIGNRWYNKNDKKTVYCVDDDNYETIGAKENGKKSPNRLKVTTISDQLHLSQNNKGKVISISLKDRAAVLSGGHTANASYWFRGKNDGKFISSSYYMNDLPEWVNKFNMNGNVQEYLDQPWNTLYDINSYTESIADENNFEHPLKGEKNAKFPHDLPRIFATNKNYDLIKSTPFGNSLLIDFAKEAINNEKLGQGKYTDFLAMSFSSTDYIGHTFGVDSKEIEDTYIRLDKDLAQFFNFLDGKLGKGNYSLFLTADHGALNSYSYLTSLKIPSRFFNSQKFKKHADQITLKYFGSDNLIENFSNFQFYFNHDEIERLKLNPHEIAQKLADKLISYDGVNNCVTAKTLQTTNFTKGFLNYLQNGYHQKLSGDLFIIPEPSTVNYHELGSEHRSGFNYDTHIPLLFYGKGIKQGKTKRTIFVTDIAVTIANLLLIEAPNGNTGTIIEEALK